MSRRDRRSRDRSTSPERHGRSDRDRRDREVDRRRRKSSERSPEQKRRRSEERHRRSSKERDRRGSPDDSPKTQKKDIKEEPMSPQPERSGHQHHRDRRERDSSRDRDRRRSPDRRRRSPPRRDDNSQRRGDDRRRQRSKSPEDSKEGILGEKGKKYGLETRAQQKWGKPEDYEKKEEEPVIEKEKVNMGTSGVLTEDTNTFRGVVIKYNEPPEAKKPTARWRLYPFKGEEALPVLHIHRQSAYLIGRDRKIADLPVDHPSCSKQHAVLQYRSIPFVREDGTKARRILPYIIDLNSGNGTFLNNEKIEPQRYVELQEKDILKFGFSTREFVVLKEKPMEEGGDAKEEPMSPE